jgi:hypothetical protein
LRQLLYQKCQTNVLYSHFRSIRFNRPQEDGGAEEVIVDHTKGDGRHREISDGKKDGRCREISDGMKDGRRRASSEGSTSSEGGDVEDNGELDVEAVENSDKPPLPDMPSDQHGQCSKTSSERSDLLPGHWLLSPKKKFPSSRLLKPACKKPKGLV